MARKVLRFFMAVIGAALGVGVVALADSIIIAFDGTSLHIALLDWALVLTYIAGAFTIGIIFFIFSPKMIDHTAKILQLTEEWLTRMPVMDILIAVMGLIVGLLVALLLSSFLGNIPLPWLVVPLTIVLYVLCGYLGVTTALRRRGELRGLKNQNWKHLSNNDIRVHLRLETVAKPKILDTSVIIDGRIFDICETGVVEGSLVIPGFVLQELRHIADSADSLKRGRGRRGLDIIQRMQKELNLPVRVEERDYADIGEVDLKLLKLAQDMEGVVVTNDYNLNKVAGVQSVPVLNINDLANAIKPVVLPGEELRVCVVKEGKESGQGVGYLDDGTMIVVEGGKRLIGENVLSVVTSVLQTSAGRMIFAKVK